MGTGVDLADPATRASLTARLGAAYAGRPVLLGPGTPAGWAPWVARLRALGCPVLLVATGRGDPAGRGARVAGPDGAPDAVVEVTPAPAVRLSDELRRHDRLVRTLPRDARAAIDRFDPGRRGVWRASPFVTSDEPVDGRPVRGGRPAAYLALEDKCRADGIWAAAGIPHAPHRIVDAADPAGLAAASAELAGPQGVVWSGDGIAGGGDRVRAVIDRRAQRDARAELVQHCTRIRVMPRLDGPPCSIHGLVLPDGTAVLRPVEIVTESGPRGRFVVRGLRSTWDPPAADRERMRAAARAVGDHLAAAHGYRGAFGIDGVLTADGFRPTELNPRMSAGLTLLARAAPDLLALLQDALLAGEPTGLGAADVETLVPLLDGERHTLP